MISSQEIIERSIYYSILNTLISKGYCINPDDYLPINKENSDRYKQDISKFEKYIAIFGVGNPQSRGIKTIPSITIESQGFMPGDIGLPKEIISKQDTGYYVSEFPYEAIDQFIDIHLISNTQADIRLLHNILFASIPQRGYIKPYNLETKPFDGNIYVEINNFYDMPDTDKGIIEKVYQFTIKDTLLSQVDLPEPISPINSIELLLDLQNRFMDNKSVYFKGIDNVYISGKNSTNHTIEVNRNGN